MIRKQPDYHSYLIRLWRAGGEGEVDPSPWRASLEDPHTGERFGFAGLDELFDFLREQVGGNRLPAEKNINSGRLR